MEGLLSAMQWQYGIAAIANLLSISSACSAGLCLFANQLAIFLSQTPQKFVDRSSDNDIELNRQFNKCNEIIIFMKSLLTGV
jgi:hypothetical protein